MGRVLRFLVIFIAIAAVLALVRRALVRRREKRGTGGAADMVQCHHCGVYLPEADALRAQGRTYCSEAHGRAERGQ